MITCRSGIGVPISRVLDMRILRAFHTFAWEETPIGHAN